MSNPTDTAKTMPVRFGDLGRQYRIMQSEIDQAIGEVLNSGWFILGKKVEELEKSFSRYCGVAHGIGVGSGTEALHLALVACGVKPGDEVITAANTCVPTVSAISFAGGVPVLVDPDPATYDIDPTRIEERITPRTRAILPVHLYGQCADMGPILDIARRHDLRVIEDCAQAHGAKYHGQMAGSMSDAGCYSFYPSKNLGAFGDGGMVVTSDPDIADRVRKLRNYGSGERNYHDIKGYNSRLDELQAAIILAKLPYLDQWNDRRRDNRRRLHYGACIHRPGISGGGTRPAPRLPSLRGPGPGPGPLPRPSLFPRNRYQRPLSRAHPPPARLC